MGYLDGELDPEQVRRVEDHLAVCVACRQEEETYREIGTMTESALRRPDADPAPPWMQIYDRLESGLSQVLLWLGITLLSGWWLWHLISDFLFSDKAPLVLRAGVGLLTAGMLLMLVSFIRHRVRSWRSDRYREVIR